MKILRQFCVVSVLTLTLALPTFAGWISTGVTSPPPPSVPANAPEDSSTETTANDPVTEIGLNLIQSVLSLF